MAMRNITSTLVSIFTIIAIMTASLAVIAYGRGYRFDIGNKSLGTNGLIAATSDPTGAQIFIDGKARSATSQNITIAPGWYSIKIAKNGYQPWEKRVRVQGEILTRVDAMLFSNNPSLFALTTSGAINPALSPDGTKLAYVVPQEQEATDSATMVSRAGVWILDLIDKPLGLNRDARQIVKKETIDTENATLQWSPDSKHILLTTPAGLSYDIDESKLNDMPVSVADLSSFLVQWKDLKTVKDKEKLLSLSQQARNVATSSMNIIAFSPDETKILYEASVSATIPQIITPALIGTNPTEEVRTITLEGIYVYDAKEDRNYGIKMNPTSDIRHPISDIQWLPSSRHLLVVQKDKIEVMDFDGSNRKVVYAGPFWDGFVAPWSNSGRVVILTNLNPTASAINNLYAVNIR